MGKLLESSMRARVCFGDFIFHKRRALRVGTYGMAHVLGVSHGTIHFWERGKTFPASTVVLQKMEIAYGGVRQVLQDIFDDTSVSLSQSEKDIFIKDAERIQGCNTWSFGRNPLSPYRHKDKCKSELLRLFGMYLEESRRRCGIRISPLGRLLGVSGSTIHKWENGEAMPQDILVYQKMDLLYGDLLKVLFGLCRRHPVLLMPKERRNVKSELARQLVRVSSHQGIAGPVPIQRSRA